jgi:molybdopterin converting factor small subunit
MPATIPVRIPTQLRGFSDGHSVVQVEMDETHGDELTVAAALDALAGACPGVVDRVLDERGNLRRHVNLFVDRDEVRALGGLEARVPESAELTILPAVSGGSA